MVDGDEGAIRGRARATVLHRLFAKTKVVESLFADGVGVSLICRDLAGVEQQQVVVVRLQPIDVEPLRGRVVIGQSNKVESGGVSRVENARRGHGDSRATTRRGASVAVPGMRMQVAREPARTRSQRWRLDVFGG